MTIITGILFSWVNLSIVTHQKPNLNVSTNKEGHITTLSYLVDKSLDISLTSPLHLGHCNFTD